MARYSLKATMGTRILGACVRLPTLALGGCDCDSSRSRGRTGAFSSTEHSSCGGPFAAAIGTAGVSTSVSTVAPVVVIISPGLSGSAAFVAGLPPIFDLRIGFDDGRS